MNLLDRLKQNGHRIPAFHLTVRPNPKKIHRRNERHHYSTLSTLDEFNPDGQSGL
ncbi:hypothetical protein Q7Z28_01220 [Glaesserella parasuis]|nr:hypothetical protein HPSD74_0635 [Glaesserella parasuis D74]MDP0316812.1 hypothetical protein [Glaesserella parasuis]